MGEIVTVNFRGDQLYGFKADDGDYLAVKPACDAMGLDWEPQRKRIARDPVLSKATSIMAVPFGGARGQDVTCIKIERLNYWLATIDSSRIKDDAVRQKVILYQEECADALHAYFSGKKLAADDDVEPDTTPSFSEGLKAVTETRQTYGIQAARQMWMKMHLPVVPAMLEPPPYQPPLFSYEAVKRDNVGEEIAA